jgi:pimeloyl-ACP methyl ester carboxylesterase
MRFTSLLALTALTTSSLVACSSGDDPTSSSSSSTGSSTGGGGGAMKPPDDGGPPEIAVDWQPCSLHSEGDGPAAECATLALPLDRHAPAGKTLPFFVKRYRAAGGTGKTALWMLQGGPGGSGYVFERVAEAMATKFPDIDYYIPDHRGTGRSSKLTCAAQDPTSPGGLEIQPAEWPGCLAEVKATIGDDLAQYTISNAASDVGLAANRVREPGQKVALLGVSYGTTWALRAMQVFPDSFDRVILDSLAPPGTSLARQDQDADEAARDLMKACGEDAGCSAKLGADPVALADGVFAKLAKGHCSALKVPAGAGDRTLAESFRLAVGSLLMQIQYRSAIFPMFYRLDRCNADDAIRLQTFLDATYGDGTADPAADPFFNQFGFVLSDNIAFAELWETPSPTAAALAAIRDAGIASRDVTLDMAQEHDIWPIYTPDDLAGKWPDASKTPVLTLAGGFDPATLLRKSVVAKEHLTGPGRHFITVPSATHFVIASSTTTANRSCGTRIMMSFLDDAEAPDTSCLTDVLPTSFAPASDLSQGLFGKPDPWE